MKKKPPTTEGAMIRVSETEALEGFSDDGEPEILPIKQISDYIER